MIKAKHWQRRGPHKNLELYRLKCDMESQMIQNPNEDYVRLEFDQRHVERMNKIVWKLDSKPF